MNRIGLLQKLGLGAASLPFVGFIPKAIETISKAPSTPVSSHVSEIIAEQVEETLTDGSVILHDLPIDAASVQLSLWQRLPQSMLKNIGDGATKTLTWIWKYDDGRIYDRIEDVLK